MTILDRILRHKREELALTQARVTRAEMEQAALRQRAAVRDLRQALLGCAGPAIIAEIKRRSPSRGELRSDLDPVACARCYAEGGAAAISVLTDVQFFGGDLATLEAVRAAVELPVLRKDFLLDAYQVDESRAHGADAVLLIVAALGGAGLAALLGRTRELGLGALVEVHDETELEVALEAGADLVGVNHRDLRTFELDLGLTARLAPRIPPEVLLVAESGIFTHDQVEQLRSAGARAFLVGESLMREPEPGRALRRLRGEL